MVTCFSSFLSFLAHIYFLAPNNPLDFLLFCALLSLPCLGDINNNIYLYLLLVALRRSLSLTVAVYLLTYG